MAPPAVAYAAAFSGAGISIYTSIGKTGDYPAKSLLINSTVTTVPISTSVPASGLCHAAMQPALSISTPLTLMFRPALRMVRLACWPESPPLGDGDRLGEFRLVGVQDDCSALGDGLADGGDLFEGRWAHRPPLLLFRPCWISSLVASMGPVAQQVGVETSFFSNSSAV